MWICEMKKQMEILILLLLNMITTAFTKNGVTAIKVSRDYITITQLSLFPCVASNFYALSSRNRKL